MRTNNSTFYILHSTLAIIVLTMIASCTPDEQCRQDENVRCVVVFADANSGEALAFDSLTVQGVGSDSLLLNNAKSVAKLSLPLRTDTTATRFVLTSGDVYQETITIYHTPAPYFVSMACGCFVYHTIDTIQTDNILLTQADILNTAVQNAPQDNIRLLIDVPTE